MPAPTIVRRSAEPEPESPQPEAPAAETAKDLAEPILKAVPTDQAGEGVQELATATHVKLDAVADPEERAELPEPPQVRAPSKARAASLNTSRVGTHKKPYERRDGVKTQKVNFTAPHGLKRRIDRFCLDEDLQTSEWIVETLIREMERVRNRQRK